MSRKDMSHDLGKSNSKKISSSSQKKHEYLYEFIVLFNWDVDLRSPFSCHELKNFTDSDIKPEWVSKSLGVNSRTAKLRNLSLFPGQVMSLFAKIELGKNFKYKIHYI